MSVAGERHRSAAGDGSRGLRRGPVTAWCDRDVGLERLTDISGRPRLNYVSANMTCVSPVAGVLLARPNAGVLPGAFDYMAAYVLATGRVIANNLACESRPPGLGADAAAGPGPGVRPANRRPALAMPTSIRLS